MAETNSDQPCGRHSLRVDGDVLVVRFVGDLSADDGRQMLAICEQVIAQHGQAYMLALVDEAGSIDPQFRRQLMTWMKTNPLLAIANVRASWVARTVGILLTNAIRLTGLAGYASAFFDSEEGARRWLADVASRHRQGRPSPH